LKKTNRVFITGLGPVTSIGIGRKQFWANATQGKSNFADITRFNTNDYPELKKHSGF
jgi:3-oxoacyl-[acyl-carrier-protein] synthase II